MVSKEIILAGTYFSKPVLVELHAVRYTLESSLPTGINYKSNFCLFVFLMVYI